MKRILASIVSLGVLPLSVLAQVNTTYTGSTGVGGLLKWFSGILALIVPILIAVAVVWFIWSVLQFMITTDEEKKKTAKLGMVWGIVAIFVMVSVWGLVGILANTFQLNNSATNGPIVPVVQ